MSNIVNVLIDDTILKDLLAYVKYNSPLREDVSNWLLDHGQLNFDKFNTADRCVGSLRTYHFVKQENGQLLITEDSEHFLNNEISYPDFLLNRLSQNLEWSYFLPDINDIIEKNKKKMKKSDFTKQLEKNGYKNQKKATINRYLGDILPVLDKANVISYKNHIISKGSRKRSEILHYARTNQRELLRLLRLAERRVAKPTLRRIYRATVKSYLPQRQYRNLAEKTQREIDEIRSLKIKKDTQRKVKSFPSKWELIDSLYDWQQRFVEKWFNDYQGIAEVVTGAGKTHLAMSIIEQLKKEYDDLHVTIVVPTIVLLEQWNYNLINKLQISPEHIGLRGGGHKDTFEGKHILIIVINSAIKNHFIEKVTNGVTHNLLIVDECHRSGASKFRNIFHAHRDWELGLSATPERERDNAYENIIVKQLGEKIGSYSYNDALNDGIIPKFDIYNYAVILTNEEKAKYDRLTKEIHRIVQRLKFRYPQLSNPKIKMEIILKQLQKKHPKDRDLFLYFQKTKERKDEILYSAENRKQFARIILNQILGRRKNNLSETSSPLSNISEEDRAIVFHEKIDEINALFMDLDSVDISIYHSGFPDTLNRIGLDLYQMHQTKILLSVKALIEGVDVPETNIGLIMASSSSQTQRIQSLGRVLRRAKGKERTKLFISYVKNTTDERIYKHAKKDWEKLIGKGNIEFRAWTRFGESQIVAPQQKPRITYVDIDEIDEINLYVGSEYPGKYDGKIASFDSQGKLFQKSSNGRTYIETDVSKLWSDFRKYKPSGGRLKINRLGHVLIKQKKKGKLITIYLGKYQSIFDFLHNIEEE